MTAGFHLRARMSLAPKDAISLLAWGIAPGIQCPREQALEARFIQAEGESRIQRWRLGFHESWGVTPGSRLKARPWR